MNIQWVILAREKKVNTDKTIDIYGICHHFNRESGLVRLPIYLIAKVNYSPNEAGVQKMIGLEIAHREKGIIKQEDTIYKVPDLNSWMTETLYIAIPLCEMDLEIKYEGEYIFSLSIDGEYKNEERLIVR